MRNSIRFKDLSACRMSISSHSLELFLVLNVFKGLCWTLFLDHLSWFRAKQMGFSQWLHNCSGIDTHTHTHTPFVLALLLCTWSNVDCMRKHKVMWIHAYPGTSMHGYHNNKPWNTHLVLLLLFSPSLSVQTICPVCYVRVLRAQSALTLLRVHHYRVREPLHCPSLYLAIMDFGLNFVFFWVGEGEGDSLGCLGSAKC